MRKETVLVTTTTISVSFDWETRRLRAAFFPTFLSLPQVQLRPRQWPALPGEETVSFDPVEDRVESRSP